MESKLIHILMASDHPILVQALAIFLQCEPDITVLGYAGDGRKTLELFPKHEPNVALMDLGMFKMESAEAMAVICTKFKHVRIVVLTNFDADEDIYSRLRSGRKGYLLKSGEPKELLDAIRTVFQSYIPATITAKLAEPMRSQKLKAIFFSYANYQAALHHTADFR